MFCSIRPISYRAITLIQFFLHGVFAIKTVIWVAISTMRNKGDTSTLCRFTYFQMDRVSIQKKLAIKFCAQFLKCKTGQIFALIQMLPLPGIVDRTRLSIISGRNSFDKQKTSRPCWNYINANTFRSVQSRQLLIGQIILIRIFNSRFNVRWSILHHNTRISVVSNNTSVCKDKMQMIMKTYLTWSE